MKMPLTRALPRIGSATLSVTALALCLSACGAEDPVVSTTAAAAGQGATAPQVRPQPGSGKVAAVNGATAQVQGPDGQTAVSWNSSTTFTQQVSGTLADVKVGTCVMVMSSAATDDSSSLAASTVRITPADDDGSCAAGPGGARGPGGMGGDRPEGMPTDLPTDLPTGMPSGMPSGAPRGLGGLGGLATGKVTSVSTTGFTVDAVAPGSDGATAREVTVSGDTTFATTAAAKASDVKVGVCVATRGDTDDTGAVTATTMQISQAVDGACTMGGGMRRMGSTP
jgi:hypothetical protein